MNTGGELFDASSADSEAKLELRGQQQLGAQRQQQRILEGVSHGLELIAHRRVRNLQQG